MDYSHKLDTMGVVICAECKERLVYPWKGRSYQRWVHSDKRLYHTNPDHDAVPYIMGDLNKIQDALKGENDAT